jgi:hypothetical protein
MHFKENFLKFIGIFRIKDGKFSQVPPKASLNMFWNFIRRAIALVCSTRICISVAAWEIIMKLDNEVGPLDPEASSYVVTGDFL